MGRRCNLSRFCVFLFVYFVFTASAVHSRIKINRLVLIGDSLADTGNTYRLTSFLSGESEKKPRHFSYYYENLRFYLLNTLGYFMKPLPPSPIYYEGRFSNGKISCDHTAILLGLDPNLEGHFLNLAYGGSIVMPLGGAAKKWGRETCRCEAGFFTSIANLSGLFSNVCTGKWWMLPTMVDMSQHCLSALDNDSDIENILVVLGNGGSDYINYIWCPKEVVSYQVDLIEKLIKAGVKHIGWGTIPDARKAPCLKGHKSASAIGKRAEKHNKLVRDELQRLSEKYQYYDVRFTFVDGEYYLNLLLENHEEFGIRVVDEPYTNINFADCSWCSGDVKIQSATKQNVRYKNGHADEYFYFDPMHPTEKAHRLVSVFFGFALLANGYDVNEPYLIDLIRGLNIASLVELFIKNAPNTDWKHYISDVMGRAQTQVD
ncbi:SGNH/GDSL hydrolase family protein [Endozoicomonadaceae bacterium StTr2]